jgi:hypothetical protein
VLQKRPYRVPELGEVHIEVLVCDSPGCAAIELPETALNWIATADVGQRIQTLGGGESWSGKHFCSTECLVNVARNGSG